MSRTARHGRRSERSELDCGVSLILVMLSMLVLSVLAATIVFTARSETLASYNYKLDTQADYLAKAGIQQAISWFRSSRYQIVSQAQANTYYKVTSTGSPYNLWTSDTSPVQCIAGCSNTTPNSNQVKLIGYGSESSNYPFNSTISNFMSDLVNVRVSGDTNNSGTISINAYLLSYQTVTVGNPPNVVATPMETWLIRSQATWTGGSSQSAAVARVEEEAVVQPVYLPTWGEAMYGYCSVSMTGSSGVCTDAFNSALGAYAMGNATVASGRCDQTTYNNVIAAGAGVGANGGVTLGSNVTVSGDVTIGSGPTAGCTANGFSGNTSSVLGEVVTGPHIDPPPLPTFPSGFPTGAPNINSGTIPRTSGGAAPPSNTTITPPSGTYTQPCAAGFTCDGSAANPYLIGILSGQVTLVGGPDVFHPVYYDINAITLNGLDHLNVVGYVVWNVKTTLSLQGNGISNNLNNAPESCQINFAGTAAALGGNGAMTAVLVAPQADVDLGGGGANGYMVGSIRARNINMHGGYPLHYDVQLSRCGGTMGVPVTSAYNRRKM